MASVTATIAQTPGAERGAPPRGPGRVPYELREEGCISDDPEEPAWEKRYGRAVLIDCMRDPRQLLVRYNAAARETNNRSDSTHQLALWSASVLNGVGAEAVRPHSRN